MPRIAILGAGPTGLEGHVRAWGHVEVFTPPGFFILGAKSYGRNSQFLLRVAWQQVDDVFGLL